jgi:hypothetical protein
MFIKTIVKTEKKSGKQYNYYRLCESYRIGNKVRHRPIISMGKLEGIESKEDKKLLADTIESIVRGENRLPLFEIKPEIIKYAKEFSDRIIHEKLLNVQPKTKGPKDDDIPTDYQKVDLHSLKHEQVREVGAEWLCKQAIDQLSLKQLLTGSCGFSEASSDMALMHITSRAVFPASEHKTAQWIKDNSAVSHLFNMPLSKINRFKLYAASNKLYSHKTTIEQGLSTKTNELFDLQDKIVFYDLTNTYFEGRKAGSKIAKFGNSKEKRGDAKIVAMAAVTNVEGFVKYSKIYQGNISDSKTLEETISELSCHTSSTSRKPVVVMDAGIITEENAKMLKAKGYDYIAVSRRKLKDYTKVDEQKGTITIYDKNENPIELQFVEKPNCDDRYLYVRSRQKAIKEASMNEHFSGRYEEDLENIKKALDKKGGTKRLEKVWERIGRLKERYPTANKHYDIMVIPDENQEKAIDIIWKRNEIKPKQGEGVYFIRTSLQAEQEKIIWTIYNTLTEIEATFRVLKTDLALRPVFHKYDENVESHLFLGLLAYQVVATIRYQLKNQGIHYDWKNIVRIMNSQKEVTTTMKNNKGKTIMIKKCSVPSVGAKQIYDALGFKTVPYYMKKYVLPEK